MKNNSIDSRLLMAQVAITNALENAPVKEALALFGYDEAKLNEGKTLYEDAEAKHSLQKKEYGEQYQATDALDKALSEANTQYVKHLQLARIALKGQRGAAEALQMDGRRMKTYSGWIKQARVFYKNAADPAIVAALARFNITEAVLSEGLAAVANVESLLATQLKEKGEAQTSTQVRDEAFEALEDWMADFRQVSRIALSDNPQMLETLGIVVQAA